MRNIESELSSILIELIDGLVTKRVAEALRDKEEVPAPGPNDLKLQNIPRKKKQDYPALFEKFWITWPANKRKEKSRAYTAWRKLSEESKRLVVIAGRNYVEDNTVRNGGQYIKYPERFITHRTFEDWLETDETMRWIKGAMDHFDSEFEKKTGMVNTWTEKLRQMAVAELQRIGREKAADKIWVFFSDRDFKIRDECRTKGYGFYTFKLLMDNMLKDTAVKRPARCPKCGEIGSHAPDCQITLDRIAAEEQEKKEIEDGRLVEFNLGDAFKKKIQEKKDVESN